MTLVLCLGNDLRRDDGVGWAVASAIEGRVAADVVVKCSGLSGLHLLDELAGWDRVLVVDAVRTGVHPPGTVLSFVLDALGADEGPSPHAIGLPTVVSLGRLSGVPLPAAIHVVAIEVDDTDSFAEGLTPAVEAAVPAAVDVVTAVLAQMRVPTGASA